MSNKIYYNIDHSLFIFDTGTITFYFSSALYRDKFKSRYLENRKIMSYKQNSRYNINVNQDSYYDLILYANIEKRGFKIMINKDREVVKCLNNIILDGEIKTLKN